MAGTRIPSNKERSELSMVSVEHDFKYYSIDPHAYHGHLTGAQELYTQVWEGVQDRMDAFFRLSRAQPTTASLSTHASFASNRHDLPHGAYPGAARIAGSRTEFGALIKSETDLNASGMDEESGAVVPTIQFDLGSNYLGCTAQPDTMSSFAAAYDYAGNSGGRVDSGVDNSRSCIPDDPSLASNLWHENIQSSNRNSSSTSMDHVPTVDYTTRWDGSDNLNDTPATRQGTIANNLQPDSDPFVGRIRPYVHEPSPGLGQKIEQALKQRLYVLDKKAAGDSETPVACEFQVLGSTGSLNTVRIAPVPSCTCADSEQSCVHILFILLRVMKVSPRCYIIWQTALVPCEVEPLLKGAMVDYACLVRQRIHLMEMLSQGGGNVRQGVLMQELRSLAEEMKGSCPICFEPTSGEDGSAKEELSCCRICNNAMHNDCFEKWSYVKQESGHDFTCLFCRNPWFHDHEVAGAGSSGPLKKRKADPDPDDGQDSGGFANLADFSSDPRGPDELAFERLYPHARPKLDRAWGGR